MAEVGITVLGLVSVALAVFGAYRLFASYLRASRFRRSLTQDLGEGSWRRGVPPAPGCYNASTSRRPWVVRYWSGSYWSGPIYSTAKDRLADAIAKSHAWRVPGHLGWIEWRPLRKED